MAVLDNFDLEANFWVVNPQFKIPKVFNSLYVSDKSKGKETSSRIMWAIALYADNSKANKFKNLSDKDRKDLIVADYLEGIKFNWEANIPLIELYQNMNMTKAQRNLFTIESKLEQRDEVLAKETYTIDNALDLDKIIINSKAVNEVYKVLKDTIEKEEAESSTRGGRIESASERGDI